MHSLWIPARIDLGGCEADIWRMLRCTVILRHAVRLSAESTENGNDLEQGKYENDRDERDY